MNKIFDYIQPCIKPFLSFIKTLDKYSLGLIPVGIFAYQATFVGLITSFIGNSNINLLKCIFQLLTLASVLFMFDSQKFTFFRVWGMCEVTTAKIQVVNTTIIEKVFTKYFLSIYNLVKQCIQETGLVEIVLIVGTISKHFSIILGQKIIGSDIPVTKFMVFTHLCALSLLAIYLCSGFLFINKSIREKNPLNILVYRILCRNVHTFFTIIGVCVYLVGLFFNGIVESTYFTNFSTTDTTLAISTSCIGYNTYQIMGYSFAINNVSADGVNKKTKGENSIIYFTLAIWASVLLSKAISPISNSQYSVFDFAHVVLWDSFLGSSLVFNTIYPLFFNINIPESYETETDGPVANHALPQSKAYLDVLRSIRIFSLDWASYLQAIKENIPVFYKVLHFIHQNILSVILYSNILAIFNFVPSSIVIGLFGVVMFLNFVITGMIMIIEAPSNPYIYYCIPAIIQFFFLAQNSLAGYFGQIGSQMQL